MIWYLLIIPLVYLLFQWHGKVEFYEMKTGKEPLKAKVIEYRDEKSPMRNDYTQIPYPYVQTDKDNSRLTKLKYANSMFKPFKIGEEIEVFFYGGILYYWNAYDKGISKYLPSKWDFWN